MFLLREVARNQSHLVGFSFNDVADKWLASLSKQATHICVYNATILQNQVLSDTLATKESG
jgi:hypothetical protein